jgi:hypothetical protein
MRNAGRAAIEGDAHRADQILTAVGIAGRNAVVKKISSNIPPPLKPATIRARQRRSKGSKYRRKAATAADTRTLVDTGQLRRSITSVVRKV